MGVHRWAAIPLGPFVLCDMGGPFDQSRRLCDGFWYRWLACCLRGCHAAEAPALSTMTFSRQLLPLAVWPVLLVVPAQAKVLAQGEPTQAGLYWQKVEKSNGGVMYVCRSKSNSKLQKADLCEKDGAKKPK
jgi:hypothetical protein